ncbi:uncharacterized protein LOC121108875 isoform X2 [Gallus gallus]|uniref:uncharacterized protein LOC121108875 isoform X2 n=1 Tax=Gallus gallus TaxID=9031 RepID=UPI001AE71F9E|nr:uncharacterized protein LOC121108875 isoform X2 [Gallus gallus]
MEADLQERTAALLRRSEAVLNQRPRTPRTHPAPPLCGRGQPAGGRSLDEDPLQRWRANRRRGFTEAPPPVTSTRRRSQSLEAARGAEPRRQRSQSDETVPPAPWGSAMGQKAAAIELLQEAMGPWKRCWPPRPPRCKNSAPFCPHFSVFRPQNAPKMAVAPLRTTIPSSPCATSHAPKMADTRASGLSHDPRTDGQLCFRFKPRPQTRTIALPV